MKNILALITILAVGFLQPCSGLSAKEQKFVSANNKFAFSLMKTLQVPGNENVLFSPYSLSAALGMIYAGARGPTQSWLSVVLGYADVGLHYTDVKEAFTLQNSRLQAEAAKAGLEVANGAAVQEGFQVLDTYYAELNQSFNAHLFQLDFAQNGQQAVNTINAWVKQATHEKIQKLFKEPLDTNTKLVLLNAITFKGQWAGQFSRELTKKRRFYNAGGDYTDLDWMYQRVNTNYGFDRILQATVVELMYRDVDYSMVILLPADSTRMGALKQFLTFETFDAVTTSLRNTTIDLYLPKFELDKQNDLKDALLKLYFNMFCNADLSGVTGSTELNVSDIVQRAIIKVDEEGTEAAGTDVAEIARGAAEPPKVAINYPFLLFIRNRITREILFAGQVNKL